MRFHCALAALLLLGGTPAAAQLSGRLSGAVVDSSGAAVPGAKVNLFLAGGSKPLLVATTSSEGLFNMLGIRPADYDLTVEAPGFLRATIRDITVDAARETPVPPIKLTLAAVTQSIDVAADTQAVELNNTEVSSTISTEDIRNLPILDRDPLGLLQLEAGVSNNGNSYTVVNGLRTSFSNLTLDGINIQDNYLRDNALDYSPNKLLLGQVRQMSVVTANPNAAAPGGATETALSTPSGTNVFTGELLWYNRNNEFAANDWFNNQAGVNTPQLNQNQYGGGIGGPIRKDKLFFYANYEGVRTHEQIGVDDTVLTPAARQGIFTYQDSSGTLHQVNLLRLAGLTGIDPTMEKLLNQIPTTINNYDVGDSTPGLLRNTAGYRFNQQDNETRDNVTGRIDYNLSTRHAIAGTFAWNRDNSMRPDLENDYSVIPKVTNPTHAAFTALSWRWTPSANLTNEVRGGFNLTYGFFLTSQQFGSDLITFPISQSTGSEFISNPVNEFLPQGRRTNTYDFSDDASWQHGRHFIQFGYWMQHVRIASYDDSGTIPTYGLLLGTGHTVLPQRLLPGINDNDYLNAQNLLATLGGYVDSYDETFNVTSRTSGYVPGAAYLRHFLLNNYALYIQDKWKALPRLSVSVGLRYEIPGIVDESNSLELLPELQGTASQTLLSNATLNFAGSSVGRPWYFRDWKEFAPSVGVAWDMFGDGKTAFRSSYAISYVNDQAIFAPEIATELNSGLQSISFQNGLSSFASSLPPISLPPYQVPITLSAQYGANPENTVGLIDPNLHRPYVQQYYAGIQHEYKRTLFEVRYVGNHMVGGYRSFDWNQVNIQANGFLADFQRAQNNGFLAMARTGVFNPAYNPSIPGSQRLTVFPLLTGGGLLTDPDIRTLIQTSQVGDLATLYQEEGLNGSVNFFQNPYVLGAELLTNYSSSSYNSLQVEVRHRMRSGLSFQWNYTFSKVLSDADGDSQSRTQDFLDIHNPSIERSRANFDQTQMFKANAFYELPLGEGHLVHYRPLNRVVGGWTVSGVWSLASGAPFSILSSRGTLNRSTGNLPFFNSSYYNTADTALTMAQLNGIVKFQMTGNGPYMVSPSAINPADGTGVNNDGSPAFPGQVFFNPGAGTLGVLQRRLFDGPWIFGLDMSALKTVKIRERQALEIRMDAFNALNHTSFYSGDQNINSPTFGAIVADYGSRLLQFGAHYRF
jgi:hypothetical protein